MRFLKALILVHLNLQTNVAKQPMKNRDVQSDCKY
jgi:hypothetical protein